MHSPCTKSNFSETIHLSNFNHSNFDNRSSYPHPLIECDFPFICCRFLSLSILFLNKNCCNSNLSIRFFKISIESKFDIEIKLMHMCFKSFCLEFLWRSFVKFTMQTLKCSQNLCKLEFNEACTYLYTAFERVEIF